MKTEWSIANVTPVGSPDREERDIDRVERDILGIILDVFLANSGRFCGRGATL